MQTWLRNHFNALIWVAAAIIFSPLVGGAFILAALLASQQALENEKDGLKSAVALHASVIERELDKFRFLPTVLAIDSEISRTLLSPSPQSIEKLNQKFSQLSGKTGAAAIYLLNVDGITLASSNWDQPISFVGGDYGFRGYFIDAMATGEGQQFAFGTLSRRPGHFIAKRIDGDRGTLGVIVVKIEFGPLESSLDVAGEIAFISDPRGIILITSEPDWRFLTTAAISDAARLNAVNNQEFGDFPLNMHPYYREGRVSSADLSPPDITDFLEGTALLRNGWRLHVLVPTSKIVSGAEAESRLIVVIFIIAIIGMYLALLYRKRKIAAETKARVAERLKELDEHLTQANKMSVLGQIAAGVGHEINQPVAAIRSYAHSGAKLLDMGDMETVRSNLQLIEKLAITITKITDELRNFARKQPRPLSAISIKKALEGAQLLLRDRLRNSNSKVRITPENEDFQVVAGHVRLEQVLVNLIQNSLDSKEGPRQITIRMAPKGQFLEIVVADDGPGIDDQSRAKLFQPFSTTKEFGLGLGLVISREIVTECGGELNVGSPAKGTEFIIRLRLAA